MTRRTLTKEEEDQVPVYLNSPYIEDDLCYTWWEDQLVWSDLEGAPWYYDENNEEIQDQDFKKRFPGYKYLTGVQVDKETFTAKYKGAYVRWSFKREQWRYRNHKLVTFEESEDPRKIKTLQSQKTNKPKYHSFWKAQYKQYQL